MSILNRLISRGDDGQELRRVAEAMEERALMNSAFVPPPGSGGIVDDFVGISRAMSSMAVYGCVRLLADTIAGLPWKVYRRDKRGIPVEVDSQPDIIRQPCPGFDLYQWKWMTVASLALRGNSFSMITERDNRGYPRGLIPLHPDAVFLERRPDVMRWFDPIYRVLGEAIPAEDIVHMRRFTMPGDPWGLSPIRQAAAAIGLSLAAEEYGYRFFKESANPTGVLSTDQNLDDASIKRQQQTWISSHQGRRLPAILTGGFKWTPLSIAPNESQFLQTKQFQRTEIYMMFGVPPHMLGDTEKNTSWGSGISELSLGFVTYTLRAWTSCIESVVSDFLPRGQFVRFDFTDLLRGDTEKRFQAYEKALQSSWLSPNEIRAMEQLPAIEGGDTYLQSITYAPLGYTPPVWSGDVAAEGDPANAANPNWSEPGSTDGDDKSKPQTVTSKPISGGEDTPDEPNKTKVNNGAAMK